MMKGEEKIKRDKARNRVRKRGGKGKGKRIRDGHT